MNKLNSSDLKSITGGIGPNGALPDNASPLGIPSWGVLMNTTSGVLCVYKGINASTGTLVQTFDGKPFDAHLAIHNASSPGNFPPPVGVDAQGCAIY